MNTQSGAPNHTEPGLNVWPATGGWRIGYLCVITLGIADTHR
jgi:hypothetical protein